jgi:hypothetical protein
MQANGSGGWIGGTICKQHIISSQHFIILATMHLSKYKKKQ